MEWVSVCSVPSIHYYYWYYYLVINHLPLIRTNEWSPVASSGPIFERKQNSGFFFAVTTQGVSRLLPPKRASRYLRSPAFVRKLFLAPGCCRSSILHIVDPCYSWYSSASWVERARIENHFSRFVIIHSQYVFCSPQPATFCHRDNVRFVVKCAKLNLYFHLQSSLSWSKNSSEYFFLEYF